MKHVALIAAALAVGLAGCATTGSTGTASTAQAKPAKKWDDMSQAEKAREWRRQSGMTIFDDGNCVPSRTRRCW